MKFLICNSEALEENDVKQVISLKILDNDKRYK